MMTHFWKGKVVVITGSSRGLGKKIARQLLASGARVVMNGRDPETLKTAEAELGALFQKSSFSCRAADVSFPEGAKNLIDHTLAVFGRLDVLINNAGLSMRGSFDSTLPSVVRKMIEANFLSAYFTTQAAGTALKESHGRVIFVSSQAGLHGFPRVVPYSASKMALIALQQGVQAEWKTYGIRTAIVFLGFVENDPEKTLLQADGTVATYRRSWQITQEKAARIVLRAVERKKRTVVATLKGRAFALAQRLFPRLVDHFVESGVEGLHSVDYNKH